MKTSRAILMAVALLAGAVAVLVLVLGADPGGSDDRQLFGLWRTRFAALAAVLLLGSVGAFIAGAARGSLPAFLGLLLIGGATLLLMEAAGQVGLISYAETLGNLRYLPTNELGAAPQPHVEASGETFQDTALGWGIAHDPLPFSYRTDQRGFRNAVDREEAAVYLLGDSIVVAGLVPFERTVTARLEAALAAPVMNVALVGIGTGEEHDLFRAAGLRLDGRLVLQFLFEGNDLKDAARAAGADATPRSSEWKRRSFVRNAELALQRWTQPVVGLAARRTCEIDGRSYLFRWTWSSFLRVEDQQAPIHAGIAAFAEEVRAAGGRYALVFVPAKLRVLGPVCDRWPETSDLRDAIDRNPLRDSTRAFCAASGLTCIDLTDPLREAARSGEIPWFWGDTHWNETGHRVAAEALLDSPALAGWRAAPAGAEPR